MGQYVYYRRHGVGKIVDYDGHWVWISFGGLRRRFEFDDVHLKEINSQLLRIKPPNFFKATINTPNGPVEVKSIRALRKITGRTRSAQRAEKEKYVSLAEAAKILSLSGKDLKEMILELDFPYKMYGKAFMIHRNMLLKLVKLKKHLVSKTK